jgi:hypothetical protein
MPTHTFAGAQVEHSDQVEPSFLGRDVGNVGNPHLIGGGRVRNQLKPILRHRAPMVTVSGWRFEASLARGAQAEFAHHAADAVFAAPHLLAAQTLADAAAPVGVPARGKVRANFTA